MSEQNKNDDKTDNQSSKGKVIKRYSIRMKKEVVLRALRGESIESLSRELGIESYIISEWREKTLIGIEASLKQRNSDPLKLQLDKAKKQIGELTMAIELLRERAEKKEALFQLRKQK